MNISYSMIVTAVFILATVGIYAISRVAAKFYPSPITTPVFFSTILIIALLLIGGYSVGDYAHAKSIISYMLGPATVALAVPLYKNRSVLLENAVPVIAGLFIGSITTIVAALAMAKALGLSQIVVASMATKSVTAAVAIEVAPIIHADASLAAVFVVLTGMFGAMSGPFVLNMCKIKGPLARGLSMGSIAHGQGTAQALTEGELQGAAAGIAMGLTALWVPLVVPFLLKAFV